MILDDENLKKHILAAVISADATQQLWKNVAGPIPKKFEQYSVCLLQAITEIWINVHIVIHLPKVGP